MADFPFLSDSDEDQAVEEILSQAKDSIVLEQVAAINCSGFTDSVLPTQLETRFQKLKSFPATSHPRTVHSSSSANLGNVQAFDAKTESKSVSDSDDEKSPTPSKSSKGENFQASCKHPERKVQRKSKSGIQRSPLEGNSESNSSDDDSDDDSGEKHGLSFKNGTFSSSKKNPYPKSSKISKFSKGSSSSWDSPPESPSPPKKGGCFFCSPKKVSRKKSGKENNILGLGFDWEKDQEFLSDLNTFSTKNQQKLMKKAMKEEEKINREAEKIVEWAKQASARMDVSGIEDDLSDDEHFK